MLSILFMRFKNYCNSLMQTEVVLSILFMRFKIFKNNVNFYFFNFQFSLWDLTLSCEPYLAKIRSFNSLYEIPPKPLLTEELEPDFQFSLWDSNFHYYARCCTKSMLSILFMRFASRGMGKISKKHWSFNSLYEIRPVWVKRDRKVYKSFQFSLWDSIKLWKIKLLT